MRTKKIVPQNQHDKQANLLGQLVTFVGGAALGAALWFHSVIPVIIGVVAMFCTLSFMNGLAS